MSKKLTLNNLFSNKAKVYLDPSTWKASPEVNFESQYSFDSKDESGLLRRGIEELKKQVQYLYEEYNRQKSLERKIAKELKKLKHPVSGGNLTIEDILKYRANTEDVQIAKGEAFDKFIKQDSKKLISYEEIRNAISSEIKKLETAEDVFTKQSKQYYNQQIEFFMQLIELKKKLELIRQNGKHSSKGYYKEVRAIIQSLRIKNKALDLCFSETEEDFKKLSSIAKKYITELEKIDNAVATNLKTTEDQYEALKSKMFSINGGVSFKVDDSKGQDKRELVATIIIGDQKVETRIAYQEGKAKDGETKKQKDIRVLRENIKNFRAQFEAARNQTIKQLESQIKIQNENRKSKAKLGGLMGRLFNLEKQLLSVPKDENKETDEEIDEALEKRRNSRRRNYQRGIVDLITAVVSSKNYCQTLADGGEVIIEQNEIVEFPSSENLSSGAYGTINEGVHTINVRSMIAKLGTNPKSPLIQCAASGTSQSRIQVKLDSYILKDEDLDKWGAREGKLLEEVSQKLGEEIKTFQALKNKAKTTQDSTKNKILEEIKKIEDEKTSFQISKVENLQDNKSKIASKTTTSKIDNYIKVGDYYIAFSDKFEQDTSNTRITSGSSIINDLDLYLKGTSYDKNQNLLFNESSEFSQILLFLALNNNEASKYGEQINNKNFQDLLRGVVESSIGEITFSMSSFLKEKESNLKSPNTLFIMSANEGYVFYSKMIENTIASLVNMINNLEEESSSSSKIGGVNLTYTPSTLKSTTLIAAASKFYGSGSQQSGIDEGPAWEYVAQQVAKTTRMEITMDIAQYFK